MHQSTHVPTSFWRKKVFVSYLLAVLVFWIHSSAYLNYGDMPFSVWFIRIFLQDLITPLAVPMFFVLSGMMFFRNYDPATLPEKLKRRVFTLVIPYLCWNILNMGFEFLATTFLSRFFLARPVFVADAANLLEGIFLYKYNSPFWFIFMLIVFAVLSPLCDLLTRNKYVGFASIVVLSFITDSKEAIDLVHLCINCMVYYLAGAMIGRYYFDWFVQPSTKRRRIVSAAVMLALIAARYYVMCTGMYVLPALKSFLRIADGLCLWALVDAVPQLWEKKVPDFMHNSFFVYALHINVSAVVTKLIYLVGPKHWFMAPINFLLTTVITLALIELGCIVLKRWMNPVYKLLSGNR